MGDLTTNFSRYEFACYCGCGFDTVDFMLVSEMQVMRDHFGKRVEITQKGGCRCHQGNIVAGGAEFSQHLFARAADFTMPSVDPRDVQSYLKHKYKGMYGIGCYSSFTHFDTRTSGPARWNI